MNRLEVDLRVLTPAFVRGASQDHPELRAPSFKGQLRWWYRVWNPLAFDAETLWSEGRVMGGTRKGEGQCPFTLRVPSEPSFPTVSWNTIKSEADPGNRTTPGGLRYLGFSLGMGKKGQPPPNHHAIKPGARFTAIHLFRNEPTMEQTKAILAAWWLLAHLGGVGSRSRRGFGSLVLEGWRWPGQETLLEMLPLPATRRTGKDWSLAIVQGLEALNRWVPAQADWPAIAPQLGPGSRVVVRGEPGWANAQAAMEEAGRTLSMGRRQHRGPRGEIEDRVTFGLPLETGRNPRLSWTPGSFALEPIDTDRHASPLHLHIGAWQEGMGQCWTLLAGPRPGLGDYRVREAGARRTVRVQAGDAVGAFVAGLQGTHWEQPERQNVFLNLNAQQRLLMTDLPTEVQKTFGSALEIRYQDRGGPAIPFPVDTSRVDWGEVQHTVAHMAEEAQQAQDILVAGRAPLPVFAYLGLQLQPWAGKRQVVVNRRKDTRWDTIDLSQPGESPFDSVTGMEGGQNAGVVAVYISVMTGDPPETAMREYLRRQDRNCAGVVTVRTSSPSELNSDNGPGGVRQLEQTLSDVSRVFPNQQGVALFVAGSAPLAFMAGRATNPNLFREVHFPNFSGGTYLPAIVHRATTRTFRWEIFLAHAGRDWEVARRLFDLVDDVDRPVFLDSTRLLPGDDWDRALAQAQRDSRVTVVLVSSHTDAAYYEREEIAQAIALARKTQHRVVPVFLPGADRDAVPYGLRLKHGIMVKDTADLTNLQARLIRLLDTLGGEP